jgi:lipopolysaccharide transport system permease protein
MFPDRSTAARARVTIAPRTRWAALDLVDLWRHRGLLYFLVWRDVRVRYKQTVLGAGWAIIQPLFTMLVFSVFFGRLAGIPSDGVPYPIFSFTGLVAWTFFANGLLQAAQSIVVNQNLVKKVYFPRLALPMAAVLAGLVDLAIAMVVLLAMLAFYGIAPTARLVWVPPLLLLALVTALGVGLWFAALNVRYRDVTYLMPFVVQVWLFATPVAYPSSLIAPEWRALYAMNPMVGVIEGFRWCLFGTATAPGAMAVSSSLAALLILVTGAYCFRAMEDDFADVV